MAQQARKVITQRLAVYSQPMVAGVAVPARIEAVAVAAILVPVVPLQVESLQIPQGRSVDQMLMQLHPPVSRQPTVVLRGPPQRVPRCQPVKPVAVRYGVVLVVALVVLVLVNWVVLVVVGRVHPVVVARQGLSQVLVVTVEIFMVVEVAGLETLQPVATVATVVSLQVVAVEALAPLDTIRVQVVWAAPATVA